MTKNEKRLRINAVMRRIRFQFPDSPEAKLCCAIVWQAANDLLDKKEHDSAVRYLKDAKHAELCGVDPVWVRESFEKSGLLTPNAMLSGTETKPTTKRDA